MNRSQLPMSIPKPRSTYVPRPRLTTLLSEIPDFPLTVVKAGAGYGKTTAVASYVQQSGLLVQWLTVREEDRYGTRFVERIGQAVLPADVPDAEWDRVLAAGRSPLTWRLSAQWTGELLSTFVHEETIIVLDDLHVVDEDAPVLQWVDEWLSYIPPNVHVVIVTRTRPALQTLDAQSDRGEVLWVRERDLAFTEDEVGFLFHEGLIVEEKAMLDRNQTRWLVGRTGGMAMVLSMMHRDWRQYGEFSRLQEALDEHTSIPSQVGRLFLLDLPPLYREVLQQTCMFSSLHPSLCDAVLHRTDSSLLLRELERKGYLTVSEDDAAFVLHPLVRDHLAKALSEQERETQLEMVIAWHLERGEESRAIPYLLSLRDEQRMAEALFTYIPGYLERGEVSTVQGWLDRLSAKVVSGNAGLLVAKAEVCRHTNRFAQALAYFGEAYALAEQKGDCSMLSQVEMGRARLYLDTIQPDPAMQHIRRARLWLSKTNRRLRFNVLQLAFENSINQGRIHRAKRLATALTTLPGASLPNNNSDVRLMLRCGEIEEVITALKPRVSTDEMNGRNALAHREATLLLSLMYAMHGEPAKAKAQALRGHGVGHSLKSPFVSAVGLIRLGHALHLENPLGEEGLNAYLEAADSMDAMEVPRGKSEALLGLCLAHGYRRQLGLARSNARQGIQIAQDAGDLWMANLVRAAYGQVSVVNEVYEAAVQELSVGINAFTDLGDPFLATTCRLWRAFAWFHSGDGRWQADFSTVLQFVGRFGWSFLLERATLCGVRDTQTLVPLLQKSRSDAVVHALSTQYLNALHSEAVENHPGYTLRVQTFGRFAVWRGYVEMERREWQREKARQLFQFLITHRNTLLHREEICEGLWGDMDLETAERDFKVALTVLSNAIEPEKPGRGPSAFIVRHGSLYGLTSHPMLKVDRDEFLQALHHVELETDEERRGMLLAHCMNLYQGPYLPEVKYETWCDAERERLERQFVQAAVAYAKWCFVRQRQGDVISTCERVLETDPTQEEAYVWLMRTYGAQYNRPMILQTYRNCEKVLNRELGLGPMESTRLVYEELMETKL